MSDPATSTDTTQFSGERAALLQMVLANSHPLMVEAFYVAAIPYWYDRRLFASIRAEEDGRTDGLIERLSRYSFISPLADREETELTYTVRAEERDLFHRRWIAEDPDAYRAAHQRALAHWQARPDPNPFAQEQNLVYHGLLAGFDRAVERLISRFRTYRNERQFAAIERLLAASREARAYLELLHDDQALRLDDLLDYLLLRLAQIRRNWDEADRLLAELLAKPGLDPLLKPYVLRAQGYSQLHANQYVEAINTFESSLQGFEAQLAQVGEKMLFLAEDDIRAERAYTLIALGRAHVGLAEYASGGRERQASTPTPGWQLRAVVSFLVSLPLILYLTVRLGRRILQPRFCLTVTGMDWIIARLFATGAQCYRQADADLERYGEPFEGTVADEEQASLYLALGHAWEAQRLYRPLAEAQLPLGPYRQAAAQVGLAEACLQLGQPGEASALLRSALPVLRMYEAHDLEARTSELLGEALLVLGAQDEALDRLEAACQHFQHTGAWEEATQLVEHLARWLESGHLAAEARGRAVTLIEGLRQRHYPGRYRHPWLVAFRKLVLLALPIVLLLAPLLTITLETSVALTPEIRFRPAPILNTEDIVSPSLSQGVARVDIYGVEVSRLLLWAAGALLLAYLLLSLLLGLAAIAFTPLRTVQAGGRGATVCLDDLGIALGAGTRHTQENPSHPAKRKAEAEALPWTSVAELVRADVCVWNTPLADTSSFGLTAAASPLVIPGSTAWYVSLRDRVRHSLPPSRKVVNLDSEILRSPLGILYLLNLAFLGVLGLLAALTRGELVFQDLPGTPYSLVDLYPWLYVMLVVAPLWWAVVQPLRRHLHLQPRSRFPLVVLGAGLALALAQVLIRFRPLLTVLNLYIPLITLILCVSAEVVLWRAQAAGRKVYSLAVRLATAALVAVVCLLMVFTLWRDLRAYHYLVEGYYLSDQALEAPESEPLSRAILAYREAVELGSQPIWGIDTKEAARLRLGVPPANRLTWLSALTNQAALEAESQRYYTATQVYSETLNYTDRPDQDQIYAWLAVARLEQGTYTRAQEGLGVNQRRYKQAIELLDTAIEINPGEPDYYLWRGLAYHALVQPQDCKAIVAPDEPNPMLEATISYRQVLARAKAERDLEVAARLQERAFTGLGWISYLCEDYARALESFYQATQVDPNSSEAWLAEGYALYALEGYAIAQLAWERARELEPQDPTILLALGTLHWRLAAVAGGPPEPAACAEYNRALELYSASLPNNTLWDQTETEVAFTHRTLGFIRYLLGNCPAAGQDRVTLEHKIEQYREAVDSFARALKLDDRQAGYWYRKGRIEYAIALVLHDAKDPGFHEWLPKALADIREASKLEPANTIYLYDLALIAEQAWQWTQPPTIDTAQWLAQALIDLQAAIAIKPTDLLNMLKDQIRDEAIAHGDERFDAGDFQTALTYYELVAENLPLNAPAAFGAGLTSLALGQPDVALDWYGEGLNRVQATGMVPRAVEALQALEDFQAEPGRSGLEIEPIVELFRKNNVVLQPPAEPAPPPEVPQPPAEPTPPPEVPQPPAEPTPLPDVPEAPDAATAFAWGLTALQQGRPGEARVYYRQGLDQAQAASDLRVVQEARAALYLASVEDESLPLDEVLPLFDQWGMEPDTAGLAFDLALAALAQGERAQSAWLYNRGIEMATGSEDSNVVTSAAEGLRDYLLAHPDVSRTDAYWPLDDDLAARQRAVALLDRPDLYWRYRAESGFRLIADRQLFSEEPGQEQIYEEIFDSIISDIERAYTLNAEAHRTRRDFFVDANIGWLYLRRADSYAEKQTYEQALADYEEAAGRIQPTSQYAALDRTEALFRAGLTALRLAEVQRATAWYQEGIDLVRRLDSQFGLQEKVEPAMGELQALVEDQPDLAEAAQPILDQLEELR